MSEVLFLSHRIPYPPEKGDKIRSYNLLKALAERYTVHVGAFIDDQADWQHVESVRRLCGGEICIRPLNPSSARLRCIRALLTGEPLTVEYYRDKALAKWISHLSGRRSLAGVFAFSSSMGQYADKVQLMPGAPRVMDFCDVDSDKWRQYAESHSRSLSLVYAREARALAKLESSYVRQFDSSLVISDAEASILKSVAGEAQNRVHVVPNGVDTDYFDPSLRFANPFESGSRTIVFTGAMDYHANVDGVRWFATEVLPAIRDEVPSAAFAIVGSNPTADVTDLVRQPGVLVTGRVPDVRPYLAHAAVVVAPLRLARGVQNKVLEALAMARPVVATPNAVQGIPGAAEAGVWIATDAVSLAGAAGGLLKTGCDAAAGRRFVLQRFGWSQQLDSFCELFARPVGTAMEPNDMTAVSV